MREHIGMVEVALTERIRKYGYLYWKRRQDDEISNLLGQRASVDVVFMNADHGRKRIDWQYRRISIGWRWTRALPESKKVLVLKLSKDGTLDIQCR
jgi:hypothetical protein